MLVGREPSSELRKKESSGQMGLTSLCICLSVSYKWYNLSCFQHPEVRFQISVWPNSLSIHLSQSLVPVKGLSIVSFAAM